MPIKIHPRDAIVYQATLKLHKAIKEAIEPLTNNEALKVVTIVLDDIVITYAKNAVRDERRKNEEPEG